MKLLNKILQSNLFKFTSLNSFNVAVKIAIGLVTSKLMAVFVGPSGLALIGNLRSFVASLENIATLGFHNGIVKYVAENKDNKPELQKIISTVFISLFIVAVVLSTVMLVFSDYFFQIIFGNNSEYQFIIKAVAIILPFNVISIVLVSITNGLDKYKKVIYANLITNLVCLLFSMAFIYYFNTIGAMISIVIIPIVLFLVSCFYIRSEIKILQSFNFQYFDFSILKNLGTFSLMVLPPAILSPIFNLQIRNFLIAHEGLEKAGFWEAMTRISNSYLLFMGSLVAVYFYPKLAASVENSEIKKLIWRFYKSILPMFCLGLIFVYLFRFQIIRLLFTTEFLLVSDLFFWQIFGDVFKVAGMILGYYLMAQKRIFNYVFIEIGALVFLYFCSVLCIKSFGVEGVVMAQAFENILYFVVLTIYFRKVIF